MEITIFTHLLHIKTIKMKKIIIMLISILSMYSSSAQKHNDQYIKDASKVAENWLNNIDNKQYENAYQALSNNVKLIYQEDIWIKQIIRLKDEIGSLEGRIANEKYFKSELEGMKNGFYVFINYTTDYKNTTNHKENLLLKQNDKLKWEILNYNYEFKSNEIK